LAGGEPRLLRLDLLRLSRGVFAVRHFEVIYSGLWVRGIYVRSSLRNHFRRHKGAFQSLRGVVPPHSILFLSGFLESEETGLFQRRQENDGHHNTGSNWFNKMASGASRERS
jgi:hypothetical protein